MESSADRFRFAGPEPSRRDPVCDCGHPDYKHIAWDCACEQCHKEGRTPCTHFRPARSGEGKP